MTAPRSHTPPRSHGGRSQSWFPGRFIPVRLITGVEVFPQRRGRVQVGSTTIHGSAAQLRALAAAIVRAADATDPSPNADMA